VGDDVGDVLAITVFEDGQDEVVLAFKVLVEGGFGDADGGEDLIQAHSLKAGGVEQIGGGIDEPMARVLRH
jgi:hypothetical protein